VASIRNPRPLIYATPAVVPILRQAPQSEPHKVAMDNAGRVQWQELLVPSRKPDAMLFPQKPAKSTFRYLNGMGSEAIRFMPRSFADSGLILPVLSRRGNACRLLSIRVLPLP
jgi:hypothetical protein